MADRPRLNQLLARWDELREQGQEVQAEELCAESPELAEELKRLIGQLRAMDWLDRAEEPEGITGSGSKRGLAVQVPPLLAGRYRLERLIAEGGFGEVWRATDTALQRPVAVKVTTLECVDEARRVARLKHPGIISVHDVGNEGGFCFIVFDLIEGTDLAERVKRGRLTWQDSVALVATVAEHLHYAHEKGFIHRDIKPANILLNEAGEPVLADFGIAVSESELRHEAVTSMGTLAYMSPEQLTPGARVDARTDLYSLGVVLYELLTGRLPFRGETLTELREQVLTGTPPSIGLSNQEAPPELERICLKCLSKDPEGRYPSGRDLAFELRKLLDREQRSIRQRG